MTIKDNVEYILEQKGMTKTALAKLIGITDQNLYFLLRGNATIKQIEKVADGLGTKPAELLADPPLRYRGHYRTKEVPTHATFICPCCGLPIKATLSE